MFETRSLISRIITQVVVTIVALLFIFPLIVMVQGSFGGLGWGNYLAVLSVPGLPLFFLNSALISIAVIITVYVASLFAAYALSKLSIRARELYFWLLLACMTLPAVVLLTPLFVTAITLGTYNTLWSVILPIAALQIPFAVLISRNFIDGIPNELFEAARVDGANSMRVFIYLVVPLSKPIAAAIVIFTLVASWNEFILPLVFLQNPSSQTVTLLPQFFVSEFSNDQTKVLASAVLAAIPEVLAYLFLQRLFERGLSAGAIK
jgi:raffinose/stachyose/melibiose transport system permease protein